MNPNGRFESTTLWQRTLATQLPPDPEEYAREKLRRAFESFRERAKILAAEIAIDLPEFTVHDISHIDALWEMADLIAGSDFTLTPTEAFVLGGAFLIHDLGMGLAAFPDGLADLRRDKLWDDSIAAMLREKLERPPTLDEIKNPDNEIEKKATGMVLRQLHAKHAERLALISWRDRQSATEYYLIEDPELRQTYGPVIGQIAHSHGWSIEQVAHHLERKVLGAPGGFSNTWTVDALKLACLLRVADASHLDERRAPSFLRALRKPSGVGAEHWFFQEKLYQPRPESDRLVYTSKSPFSIEEAESWWLCFDALQLVDHELRQVDVLLADAKRPRLSARGVSYVEEPKRLARLIGTVGWEPVEAKIKVGDVARLIANLGGEQLYGRDETAPLRELIQNASDAVCARRLLEDQADNWGDVFVRYGEDTHGQWIEVEDTGIGMSSQVLTGPFLDFGTSFWGSDLMHHELPGLEAKGFSSTGKYGIGFFSVFMWGERVHIVTRRYEKAREDTLVLEFERGTTSRPLLRKAQPDEFIRGGGTRVRVWLKNSDVFKQILALHSGRTWTLEQRCAWLCPTLDVNLYTEIDGKVSRIVAASDWITLNGADFLKRILGQSEWLNESDSPKALNDLGNNLRLLKNSSGQVVGRACIGHPNLHPINGVVTVGGFRAGNMTRIMGVLIGNSYTASRAAGIPIVEHEILMKWASEQAATLTASSCEPQVLAEYVDVITCCGGEVDDLPIAIGCKGWMTVNDIVGQDLPDEILIIQDRVLLDDEHRSGKINLHKNVFAASMTWPMVLIDVRGRWWPQDDNPAMFSLPFGSLCPALMPAIAKAWDVSVQVLAESLLQRFEERKVGTRDGKDVVLGVQVINKSKVKASSLGSEITKSPKLENSHQ